MEEPLFGQSRPSSPGVDSPEPGNIVTATENSTGLSRTASPQRSAPAVDDVELGDAEPAPRPEPLQDPQLQLEPQLEPKPTPDRAAQTRAAVDQTADDDDGSTDSDSDDRDCKRRFSVFLRWTAATAVVYFAMHGLFFGGQLDRSAPFCWNPGDADWMETWVASGFIYLSAGLS